MKSHEPRSEIGRNSFRIRRRKRMARVLVASFYDVTSRGQSTTVRTGGSTMVSPRALEFDPEKIVPS